jgi:hypothetical protein
VHLPRQMSGIVLPEELLPLLLTEWVEHHSPRCLSLSRAIELNESQRDDTRGDPRIFLHIFISSSFSSFPAAQTCVSIRTWYRGLYLPECLDYPSVANGKYSSASVQSALIRIDCNRSRLMISLLIDVKADGSRSFIAAYPPQGVLRNH